jgi:hypothetical protein
MKIRLYPPHTTHANIILSDPNASRLQSYALDLETGSFDLVGQDVDLVKATTGQFTLSAHPGEFELAGPDVEFRATRRLSAGSGTFSLAGLDANLLFGLRPPLVLQAETGSFNLAGSAADLVGEFIRIQPEDQGGGYTPPVSSKPLRSVLFARGHANLVVSGRASVAFGRYVPRTFVHETFGGAIVGADSYAQFKTHQTLVIRAIPALPQASGRATLLTHTHRDIATSGRGGIIAFGGATCAVAQHTTLHTIVTGKIAVSGEASVDRHVHTTLDVVGVGQLMTDGEASVDRSTHTTLDVVGDVSAVASGHGRVHFIPARSVNVVGRGGVVTSGVASVACIVDTLTDEELLFLLEAA